MDARRRAVPDDARSRSARRSRRRSARHAGVETELSTTGGTSDGRFISRICDQVVEFGPVNASIHKIDEHVEIASLDVLKNVYRSTLEQLVR